MLKEHLKKLGLDSAIYGLGGVINRLLSFFLIPLFTRYLQPQDYGIMSMIALLSVALAGVFTLGTGNSMGIYYFGTEIRRERGCIVWTTVLLLLINIMFLTSILIMLSPYLSLLLLKTKEYALLIKLSLCGFALQNVAIPFISYLRMERRQWHYCFLTVFSSVLTISLNIVAVVVLDRGIRGMMEVNIVVGALYLILLVAIVIRQVPFAVNLTWIPKLVKTGWPSIFGVGAFFVVDWADRAFIQHYWGLNELGIYSVGYNFGMVMILFAEGSFGSAWPAYFMSFINKRDEAAQIFGKIFKYALFGYGILTLIFFIAARPIVTLMTAIPFHGAWTVVGMVAAAYVMKVLYLIMLPPLYFEKKLHIQTVLEWVAAIINLGLNILLIPIMKKDGAALATLISYVTLPLLTCWIAQRLMHTDYEWKNIRVFCIGFTAVAIISFAQLTEHILVDTAIGLLLLCFYVYFIYHKLLTNVDKELLHDVCLKLKSIKLKPYQGSL